MFIISDIYQITTKNVNIFVKYLKLKVLLDYDYLLFMFTKYVHKRTFCIR